MIPCRPISGGLALLLTAGFIIATGARLLGHHDLPHRPGAAERRQINVPIQDFSLRDQSGKNFSFRGLRGKLVVLTFVYTTCPDLCPLITSSLQRV